MQEMASLIRRIIVTAEQVAGKVRYLQQYPPVGSNPEAARLEILCVEVATVGGEIAALLANPLTPLSLSELKERLTVSFEAMSSLEEMSTMLIRTLPGFLSDDMVVKQLKTEVASLKQLFTQLVPYIREIYGKRESLFIVTPEFQSLGGIWL